jgi:hypothetical protein
MFNNVTKFGFIMAYLVIILASINTLYSQNVTVIDFRGLNHVDGCHKR